MCQSFLNKRLVAPIKEIVNGASQAFRAVGVLVVTGAGGLLASMDVNAPFLLVGIFDILLCLVILTMLLANKLEE